MKNVLLRCDIVCCLSYPSNIMQAMAAVLHLNLSWIPDEPDRVGDLVISRGRDDVLTYDDGINLQVHVIDPASYDTVDDLIASARTEAGPGRVALVAGSVPVEWRAALRHINLSFIDVDGVAEITWPRLRLATRQFARHVVRRRDVVPLQKGHALVAEELLIAAASGAQPSITELAQRAEVSVSTASRAVRQLAEQGMVERKQNWRQVAVRLVDITGLADLLADRTAWPGSEVVTAYAWGRNIWDVAAAISRNAAGAGIEMAITGRAGAAFLGVLGTSSPGEVRCWAALNGRTLPEIAGRLQLEPAPRESANVRMSADPWRIGVHRRADAHFDGWTATVAHPLRVWCDLHGEARGREFASQLWRAARSSR